MSQYFSSSTSNKRSELSELSDDLNSPKLEVKKEALKKVIAHMTIGKDVSPLFQSVIKCLEVKDLEIIKLVYLYIINYSRTKPDDAIMVVNLFRQSATNKTSPLIRALAVRTMGCVRVKKINEYLIQPLKDLLNDEDPYVKKTAILCVPKVYEVSPELVEQHGIVDQLNRMLSKEGNSLVLANLIITLQELSEMRGGKSLLHLNYELLQKLLLALNEGVEWGHLFIIDSLIHYVPADAKEAESIIDRIIPRLSHINCAIVLSSIKVIVKYMDYMTSTENVKALCKKISQPLVSLLKQPSEIQYLALRNLTFIVEKRPTILEKDPRVVFVDFNDPNYVKLEKLDLMTRLADQKNYELVINELANYANGIEVDFGRKALKAISKICIRIDKAAEKCVSLLKTIITECSGANHVLSECCSVLQVVFRKYPEKFSFDGSIQTLIDNLESITETEPRGSLVWLIGEFAEKISNSTKLLTKLVDSFNDEAPFVQLQILSASVKNYLKKPDETEDLIATVLPLASDNNENPDVRDRGYIYWRLLSSDPEKTKKVVLGDRPIIVEDSQTFEENLMNNLIENIGMVSSVFHKTPQSFLPSQVNEGAKRYVEEDDEETESPTEKEKPTEKHTEKVEKKIAEKPEVVEKKTDDGYVGKFSHKETKEEHKEEKKPSKTIQKPTTTTTPVDDFDLLGEPITTTSPTQISKPISPPVTTTVTSGDDDLLGMDLLGGGSTTTQKTTTTTTSLGGLGGLNLGGFGMTESVKGPTPVPYEVVLNENTAGQSGKKGVKVEAAVLKENGRSVLSLKITNQTGGNLNDFLVQLKPNYFGLTIESTPLTEVSNFSTGTMKLNINSNGQRDMTIPNPPIALMAGFKTNIDVFYFTVKCMFHTILDANGKLSADDFKSNWKNIPDQNELKFEVQTVCDSAKSPDGIKDIAARNNIFFITERKNEKGQQVMIFTAKSPDGTYFLVDIASPSLLNMAGISISCRSANKALIPLFLQCSQFIFTQS